jgi:hypothetical protein
MVDQPKLSSSDRKEAEEKGRGLVVSGSDASRLLQSVELALDVIAVAVASEVASRWLSTGRLGRDDWQNAAPEQVHPDTITVISFVSEQGLGLDYGHISCAGKAP